MNSVLTWQRFVSLAFAAGACAHLAVDGRRARRWAAAR